MCKCVNGVSLVREIMYLYIKFGGRGFFSFGDIATFQKWPNFPFEPWTIVHGH